VQDLDVPPHTNTYKGPPVYKGFPALQEATTSNQKVEEQVPELGMYFDTSTGHSEMLT
jgi:hypothetical protein